MTINGQDLADIRRDLTATGTSEDRFRSASVDVATQVNDNQLDVDADRTITLTGDVTGTTTFNIGDDANRNISIATNVSSMSITGADIQSGTITTNQIANGTITSDDIMNGTITENDIAATAKRRFTIRAADGTTLLELDALVPTSLEI